MSSSCEIPAASKAFGLLGGKACFCPKLDKNKPVLFTAGKSYMPILFLVVTLLLLNFNSRAKVKGMGPSAKKS